MATPDNEQKFYSEIIAMLKEKRLPKAKLMQAKLILAKKHGIKDIPTDIQILMHTDGEDLAALTPLLTTKPIRTQAGVAVVAIMTHPWKCPHGKCIYCPGGPGSHFGDVPQSYTGNEPATMRAIRNNYDPYLQVWNRLEQYVVLGQSIGKIELIIMGGTFPAHPKEYKEDFVTRIFQACNDFSETVFGKDKELDIIKFKGFFELPGLVNDEARTKSIHEKALAIKAERDPALEEEQEKNETANARVVALCIETKPDWCTEANIDEMLHFGTTRVELGVQTLKEDVLKNVNRGHTLKKTWDATRRLKDALIKVTYHMMPGLPGTTNEEDIQFFRQLFNDENYKPDALKIYPCMVMPGTKLHEDYENGKYSPLTTEQAAEIISEGKRFVPSYCRIMRVQRDIPTKFSKAGVDRNNLRQIIEAKMKDRDIACKCIRCREARLKEVNRENLVLKRADYEANAGKEVFLSFEDPTQDVLVGFLRLRKPSSSWRPEFTAKTAGIREIHVYSRALRLGTTEKGNMQHQGLGKELMREAERIAREEWGCDSILVISGIGVREYYRKLGYERDGAYMSKRIS